MTQAEPGRGFVREETERDHVLNGFVSIAVADDTTGPI